MPRCSCSFIFKPNKPVIIFHRQKKNTNKKNKIKQFSSKEDLGTTQCGENSCSSTILLKCWRPSWLCGHHYLVRYLSVMVVIQRKCACFIMGIVGQRKIHTHIQFVFSLTRGLIATVLLDFWTGAWLFCVTYYLKVELRPGQSTWLNSSRCLL